MRGFVEEKSIAQGKFLAYNLKVKLANELLNNFKAVAYIVLAMLSFTIKNGK